MTNRKHPIETKPKSRSRSSVRLRWLSIFCSAIIMWWNLSIHSIFVLLLTVTSGQYNDPIYPVENVCLAILNRLSETAATFLDCACKRARPFKLCEGCIDHYVRLEDLVHLLDKVIDLLIDHYWFTCFIFQSHSDSKQTITCKQFLESYDSIQLVARLINFVQSIWTSSVCDGKLSNSQSINILLECVSYIYVSVKKKVSELS